MAGDKLVFLEGTPDTSGLKNIPVYYTPQYLNLIHPEVKGFAALHPNSKRIIMLAYFQCIENEAVSLREAPFGGVHCTQAVDNIHIDEFFQFIAEQLSAVGITRVTVKFAPSFYPSSAINPSNSETSSLKKEINHHLSITSTALSNQMAEMQHKRLKKCVAANFNFIQEVPDQLDKIYAFIQTCRAEKGHAISVSLNRLTALTQAHPSRYLIFSCYHQGQLVATSICVAVNDQVLYNFLPVSLKAYNAYSPMVFLLSKIYEYGQQHHFETLDLGTSMLGDLPNEKLVTFKNRMGGIQTERSICSWDI